MFYPAFLSLMSQLTESHKASIVLDSRVVSVEKLEGHEAWQLTIKLGTLDTQAFSCFSQTGRFLFQQGDIVLRFDPLTTSVFAVQKIQMPAQKYIPFKQRLTYFLEVVSQYEEMLTLQTTF